MATPNFVLMVEHRVRSYDGNYGQPAERTLPAGTFVRPIEPCYVPKHVLDREENKWFNKEKECYCFTHYGIVVVPKALMRQV